MDMSRHLRRWLNDKALRDLGDTYEGRIASVTEETIRNRFTAQKQLEPVVTFEDGWKLVPNLTQRRTLIEFFGHETDDWIGQRLIVFRHYTQKTDTKTGLVRESWQKSVKLPAALSLRKHA
jgi:hypothetical protein